MSGEREWPVTGFRYRCSTGHWVISRRGDLADTACPAKFGNYTVMLGDSVLCGGTLGDPMVDGSEASDEIVRLRGEVESQTFWAELLAGNNCWCVADDVGVCVPCAYRQTMRQNEEARRGGV